MTRLTRINQPIFAGNAPTSDTSVFGTMKTTPEYTSDVAESINTPIYGEGWKSAVELDYAPFIEDMNTVQKEFSYQIAYDQQEGISEWSGNTTYYKGSIVKVNTSSGAQLYVSKSDDNIGNLPSNTAHWKMIIDSSLNYALDSDVVKLIGNQTISGTKTFSSTISGNINGNAETVTNGVYTTGNQTIGGVKTFSSSPILPTPSTSDNSTKGATTAFVNAVIQKIFPVNSIYSTYTNTNPSTILGFGTWTLFATNVVTSLSSTAPVKGNGTTIGFTTGDDFGGLFLGSTGFAKIGKSNYGVPVGTARIDDTMTVQKTIGITEDSSKSGMIADLSSSANKVTVYMWRRTA